ncbi:MAG TPA: cellulase family glycosylhydrolase [Capsulimonadaceae bacterium]|jgi:hypothetical protein
MHNYSDYGWLRGFSIVPSWGARIEDAWWNYDPHRFRDEIAPAVQFHANTLRVWIEFTAWMADPDGVTAAFQDAVAAIDEAGMKTMPCLFNRWHDSRYDYGGTYMETLHRDLTPHFDYVEALVAPLADDDRILIWDLCNEPGASSPTDSAAAAEIWWMAAIRDIVLRSGAKQPITIGTMSGRNIEAFAPMSDVLCCHPYLGDPADLDKAIAHAHRLRTIWRKPMLCNETGMGAADDLERAEYLKWTLPMLADAGIGWMGWALRPGKAISTRRDRVDGNGLHGFGYHPWVDEGGAPRKGLEWLCEKPERLAPWLE